MAEGRDASVKAALSDLEAAHPGSTAGLVLRNGAMHAGRAPPAVAREIYAAMAATMLASAEAASADLGDDVALVEARLKGGALLCAPVGRKLLLVLHAPGEASPATAAAVASSARRLAGLY
jgi:predicted regulator of Ras-like GTPase activity (Roadblock/LC7/MglB family)